MYLSYLSGPLHKSPYVVQNNRSMSSTFCHTLHCQNVELKTFHINMTL